MRDSTQTAAITVLLAIALATTAPGSAVSQPAAGTNVQPVRPTVSGPAERVVAETVQISQPAQSAPLLPTLSDLRSKATAGAVLLIPSTQMKPEDTTALIEDMSIMSRIFEKRLADEHLIRSGYAIFRPQPIDPFNRYFARDNRTTQAIYIQGFGSLFLINVDFPLSPPPQVEADKPQDSGDKVWATAKDDIRNPTSGRRRKQTDQKREYDAEQVDDLQRTLIKTLKHAANIRGLKAEESVTITARGSEITVPLAKDESPLAAEYRRMTGELTAVQPTFLTIRAKKPDIDSFAKDELDYDQFRQRIQTLAY